MTDKEYATPFSVLHAVSLLSHSTRLRKFNDAIERIVKPGDNVIDLGTGSGILAILAARRGARVTAIDIDSGSLKYAKEAARMNKVENMIRFVHSHFYEFMADERADLVMCEMLSSIMLIEQQIPACNFAVKNLLKPSGTIIPQSVQLFVVPVQNEILWNRFEMDGLLFPRVPQSVEPGQSIDIANLLELAEFDLTVLNSDAQVDKTLNFPILQTGTIHGLNGMFEAVLYDNITLSMNDGWREIFLPLPQPVEVVEGGVFAVRIAFRPGEYDSLDLEIL